MADEKEKKTTTAKAPAKTVRRVKKTAQKVETVQKKPEVQKEERRMSQEALGMVETLSGCSPPCARTGAWLSGKDSCPQAGAHHECAAAKP